MSQARPLSRSLSRTAVACGLAAALAGAQVDDRAGTAPEPLVFATVPVWSLTRPAFSRFPVPGPLRRSYVYEEPLAHLVREAAIEPLDLKGFLSAHVAPASWQVTGTRLQAREGVLELVQTHAVIAEVERAVRALARQVAPRLVLDVALFDVALLDRARSDTAALGPSTGCERLDPARAGSLWERVRSGGPGIAHAASIETVPGRWEYAGERDVLGVLDEIMVEWTQKELPATAWSHSLELARGVALMALPSPDGRALAIAGVLVWQEHAPPAPLDVRFFGQTCRIDRIDGTESRLRFSLALASGEGLLLPNAIEARPELCLLLRAAYRDQADAAADPGFTYLPHALLTSRWLAETPFLGREIEAETAESDALPPRPDPESLAGWIGDQVAEHDALSDASVVVHTAVGQLVAGTRQERAAVRDLVAGLARHRQRTFVLTLQRETRPKEREGDWRADDAPLSMVLLAQTTSVCERGRTRSRFGDVNLEGSNLWWPCPQIRRSWTGIQLAASVDPRDDVPLLTLDLEETGDLGSRTVTGLMPQFGDLELTQTEHVGLRTTMSVELGAWREACRGLPRLVGGEPCESRILIQLRELAR